jgi:DNA-binding transcriptional LysR family regulator
MKRDDLYDLAAFAVVAEQRSFTRAAAELGMSQSGLSHAVRALEERLGVRLLSRTTRSVSTTEAGETLLRSLRPALEAITSGVTAVGALRGKPSGTVRITATRHAVSSAVMPVLPRFLASHPDIRIDMIVDDNLTDIVADRIDAGIRFGDIVEKDMIAVRIGPDIRMAVVGAPSYFSDHPVPRTPRELSGHQCINYRRVRSGGLYAWDFEEKGRPFEVRVEGRLVFNNAELIREAALAGQGIAYVYEDEVVADVKAGRLKRILERWCPTFPGYYLYHPSRRQTPPALAAIIAALRYKP